MTRNRKLGIVLAVFFVAGAPLFGDPPRTITVTGRAESKIKPDRVVVVAGVYIFNADLAEAKRQHDERMKRILSLAPTFKIDAKDIETDYLSMHPTSRREKQRDGAEFDVNGFSLHQTLSVKLRDVARFEPFLSALVEAGANVIHRVSLDSDEAEKELSRLRLAALDHARQRATEMARTYGQSVGRPLSVTDGEGQSLSQAASYGYRPDDNFFTGDIRDTPTFNQTSALGQICLEASVTVSFELIDEKK